MSKIWYIFHYALLAPKQNSQPSNKIMLRAIVESENLHNVIIMSQ